MTRPPPISTLFPNTPPSQSTVLHDQAWYNQAIIVAPKTHSKVFIGETRAMTPPDDAGGPWRVMTDWLPGSQSVITRQVPPASSGGVIARVSPMKTFEWVFGATMIAWLYQA